MSNIFESSHEVAKIYVYALKLKYKIVCIEVFNNTFKIKIFDHKRKQYVYDFGKEWELPAKMTEGMIKNEDCLVREYILKPNSV